MKNLKTILCGSNNCRRIRSFKGVFYAYLGSLFSTTSALIVKTSTSVDPRELSLMRSFGFLLGSLPILAYHWINPLGTPGSRILLIAEAFVVAFGNIASYYAFRLLPLTLAITFQTSLPVVVAIGSRIFLKESCGLIQSLLILLTVIGLVVATKLPDAILNNQVAFQFTINYITGISLALCFVLFCAAGILVMRRLQNVHFSTVIFYYGFIGVPANIIANIVWSSFSTFDCPWDKINMLLIAAINFCSGMCYVIATQCEVAAIVAIIRACSDIINATLLQFIFLQTLPDIYGAVGAVLVTISVATVSFKKWLLTLEETSVLRKKFRVLLK